MKIGCVQTNRITPRIASLITVPIILAICLAIIIVNNALSIHKQLSQEVTNIEYRRITGGLFPSFTIAVLGRFLNDTSFPIAQSCVCSRQYTSTEGTILPCKMFFATYNELSVLSGNKSITYSVLVGEGPIDYSRGEVLTVECSHEQEVSMRFWAPTFSTTFERIIEIAQNPDSLSEYYDKNFITIPLPLVTAGFRTLQLLSRIETRWQGRNSIVDQEIGTNIRAHTSRVDTGERNRTVIQFSWQNNLVLQRKVFVAAGNHWSIVKLITTAILGIERIWVLAEPHIRMMVHS